MPMKTPALRRRSRPAAAVFGLLDPAPFGMFLAALVFDVVYAKTGELLWMKSAAWLIAFGLIVAVIPRLINLASVWLPRGRVVAGADRVAFLLNLLAIVAAIFNAFVHSRDAYAVIPTGVWLSAATVVLLALANIVTALHHVDVEEIRHA
jgi:uncharacterized membrane protein